MTMQKTGSGLSTVQVSVKMLAAEKRFLVELARERGTSVSQVVRDGTHLLALIRRVVGKQ